ncbi:cold shock domain-containing protein [Micromonospora sp. STR1s_5]|nr:cold shock domain-containing protein [Micromonospora sp. STR1s_5]
MKNGIVTGQVSWFKFDKKFGFVSLWEGGGDAFLHMSALKAASYVSVPAGTTMQVRVETEEGRLRVTEVIAVDVSTARPGQPAPVIRKNAGPTG